MLLLFVGQLFLKILLSSIKKIGVHQLEIAFQLSLFFFIYWEGKLFFFILVILNSFWRYRCSRPLNFLYSPKIYIFFRLGCERVLRWIVLKILHSHIYLFAFFCFVSEDENFATSLWIFNYEKWSVYTDRSRLFRPHDLFIYLFILV